MRARLAAAAAALAILAGCASLGLVPAQTPAQKLGYAYGGVTAALQTLGQAVSQGAITSAEATTVNGDIMAVSGALDTARQAICGADPQCTHPASSPTAMTALTAATATLAKISAYLACKQAKGASCPLP